MRNEVSLTVTVPVPASLAFRVWAEQTAYPEWLEHLAAVEATGDRTHRWTLCLPDGRAVTWETETTVFRENERIAWSSFAGDLVTYGQVRIESLGPRRSRVHIRRYHGVGRGQDPTVVQRVFGDPAAKLKRDVVAYVGRLRRLAGGAAAPAPRPGAVRGAGRGTGRAAGRPLTAEGP